MRAILTYHSIDESGSPISLDAETFRRHVAWLASGSVRVVPLAELPVLPDDTDAVALTFDDALASVAAVAAPWLEGAGLPATVFVPTAQVGKDNRWGRPADPDIPVLPVLGWEALGRLAEGGWDIGAHSRRHVQLTDCGDTELDDELAGAAEEIEAALGRRPRVMAYPYGAFDRRVAAASARTYAFGCTTELRPLGAADRLERLPRLDAYYFRNDDRLRAWGTGPFRRYLAARRTLRTLRRLGRR